MMNRDGLFTQLPVDDEFDESIDPYGIDWYDTVEEWQDAQLDK